jgi:cytochrome c oxidase cbb3-type subunit 3
MTEARADTPAKDEVIHEYDGIEECDNRLPAWWLTTLYGTIAFALGYWFWFEGFRVAPGPIEAYRAEAAAAASAEAARIAAMGTMDAAGLVALSKDAATLASGKEAFGTTCSACHATTGGGGIGPNLTAAAWLHGGAPLDVYRSVREGWTDKGMPAWGPQLGEARVRAVAAYVLTLRDTNVPGGKAPQGEPTAN